MTRDEMIETLKSTGKALEEATSGLTEEDLRWRPASGDWSIKEVVCHLREFSQVYSDRLEKTLKEESPFLKGYDQEVLAREKNYQNADWGLVLPAFILHRGRGIHLLTEMEESGWDRPCHHEEAGPMTLEELVARMARHDLMHLEQIEGIKKAMPKANEAGS